MLKNAGVKVKFANPNVGANMTVKHQIGGVSFNLKKNQDGLLPDDLQAIYIYGAYLPDPTGDQNRRGFHSVSTQSPNRTFGFNGVLLKSKSTVTLRIQSHDPF